MQVKTIKLSAFDGIELKEATFHNQIFPEHFHDCYSIGIIEKGIERLSFGGKLILAHSNATVIINPYDVHANSFYDNDTWKYRIIYVSPDVMKYVQKRTGLFNNKTVFFPKQLFDDPCLYQLILNFHLSPAAAKINNLHSVLIYLLHHYALAKPENDEFFLQNEITDATRFLQCHSGDKIILDEVAGRYGMDKFKFIRLFKKQTGLTPVSYLLLHRINQSKRLIAERKSIVDVALETGFYDQSHFNHYFKKYIGISPLEYRKGCMRLE